MLSKSKSGKWYIAAEPNKYQIGQTLTVGYNLSQFPADGAKAEVKITDMGKSFHRTVDLGYYDDNRAGEIGYDDEGFRKTGQQTMTLCYYYVDVIRKIDPPKPAKKYYVVVGMETVEVDTETAARLSDNNRKKHWVDGRIEYV